MAMDRTAGVAGLEQRSSGQPEIGGPFEHSRPAHDGMDQVCAATYFCPPVPKTLFPDLIFDLVLV